MEVWNKYDLLTASTKETFDMQAAAVQEYPVVTISATLY